MRLICLSLLLLFFCGTQASAVQLKAMPWPTAPACLSCANVRFDRLSFRMPMRYLRHLEVRQTDRPFMVFSPVPGIRKAVFLGSLPQDHYIRGFMRRGWLHPYGVKTTS